MQFLGGLRNAAAISKALIARSRFIRLLSRASVSQSYMKAKIYIDRVAAGILGLLGLRLLLNR